MFIILVTSSPISSSIFISFVFYQKVTHYWQLWLLLTIICHYNTCKVLCIISEVPQYSPPIVCDIVQYMLCMHAVSTSRKLYVLIFVTIYFEVSKYNLNMKFALRYLLIGILELVLHQL